jgi:hypothetical protein
MTAPLMTRQNLACFEPAKLNKWNFGSTTYCNGWPCRNTG